MKNLVDSGCRVLQFGIESGSERVLKMINKKINIKDVLEINKYLAAYPIKIKYNFIIGFPSETAAEINDTLSLMEKLKNQNSNVESPFLNIYTPYPGTPLYTVALDNGFKAPDSLEGWASYNWNTSNLNFLTQDAREYLKNLSVEYFSKSSYPK